MRRIRIADGLVCLGIISSSMVGCGHDEGPVNTAIGTAAGPIAWTRVFGGDAEQMGWQLATTESGQIVLAGTMQKRVDFGPAGQIDSVSDNDIFLAWIETDGTITRVRRFGESGGHIPTGLAIDSGGGVLLTGVMIGSINFGGGVLDSKGGGDAFLASFSASGDYRFAVQVGNQGEQSGGQIEMASDGGIIWTGTYEGDIDIGGTALKSNGQSDLYVAKIGSDGKTIWAHTLGGTGFDGASSLAMTPQGQILMSGFYEGSPNLGDGALPNTDMSDGAFLVALDADGKFLWSHGSAHNNGYFPYSVHVDENGTPWLIGACGGDVDLFGTMLSTPNQGVALVKLNLDGQPMSSQIFPADEVGFVSAMHASGGGFVIAGDFTKSLSVAGQTLSSAGGSDIFVIWADGEGRVTRQTRVGGSGDERFGGISILPTGRSLITGDFDGALSVGGAAYSSANGPDAFLLLLN